MDDFKGSIQRESYSSIKTFILYAMDFERRNGEVLEEIKEQIMGEDSSAKTFVGVLDQLIKAEKNHLNTLEKFLPKEV